LEVSQVHRMLHLIFWAICWNLVIWVEQLLLRGNRGNLLTRPRCAKGERVKVQCSGSPSCDACVVVSSHTHHTTHTHTSPVKHVPVYKPVGQVRGEEEPAPSKGPETHLPITHTHTHAHTLWHTHTHTHSDTHVKETTRRVKTFLWKSSAV